MTTMQLVVLLALAFACGWLTPGWLDKLSNKLFRKVFQSPNLMSDEALDVFRSEFIGKIREMKRDEIVCMFEKLHKMEEMES
jgi:hypothetical protein